MLDETRRLLVLFIGECWHEKPKQPCGWDRKECSEPCNLIENGEKWDTCPHGKKHYTHWVYPDRNRPFTGPEDAQVVKDKLMEKGLWEEFHIWARDLFGSGFITVCSRDSMEAAYNAWIWSYYTNAADQRCYRLCELAGEWPEMKKIVERMKEGRDAR